MARKAKTFGQELIESAHEAVAIAAGEARPARAYVPEKVDVPAIRAKAKMSQSRFADAYCIPIGTLRDWEQDRRQPDQTARVLLAMIEREPIAIAKILQSVSQVYETAPEERKAARMAEKRAAR